jgi:hypothetical protein
MNVSTLRERVYCLAERHSSFGIGPDVTALTVSELQGVYLFLQRVDEELRSSASLSQSLAATNGCDVP